MDKISDLENRLKNLHKERRKYVSKNKHRWKTVNCNGNSYIEYDTEADLPNTPKPLPNGFGRFGAKVLKQFDTAINSIQQKINEVKNGEVSYDGK